MAGYPRRCFRSLPCVVGELPRLSMPMRLEQLRELPAVFFRHDPAHVRSTRGLCPTAAMGRRMMICEGTSAGRRRQRRAFFFRRKKGWRGEMVALEQRERHIKSWVFNCCCCLPGQVKAATPTWQNFGGSAMPWPGPRSRAPVLLR